MPAVVARAPVKAVCQCRPVAPCEAFPKGLPGLALIDGQPYLVGYHGELPETGEPIVRGYWMMAAKEGGKRHDIDAESLTCDCPDALFRERACKHNLSLAQLLLDGNLS